MGTLGLGLLLTGSPTHTIWRGLSPILRSALTLEGFISGNWQMNRHYTAHFKLTKSSEDECRSNKPPAVPWSICMWHEEYCCPDPEKVTISQSVCLHWSYVLKKISQIENCDDCVQKNQTKLFMTTTMIADLGNMWLILVFPFLSLFHSHSLCSLGLFTKFWLNV